MVQKDKRVRINKKMVAWSDGNEIHMPPSVRREVGAFDYRMDHYHWRVEKGYELQTPTAVLVGEALIWEEKAESQWNEGRHIDALRTMMYAAGMVIEVDDDDYREYLDPCLNPPSKAFIATFIRLAERCEEWCREDPRLWDVFKDSCVYEDIRLVRRRYRHWL